MNIFFEPALEGPDFLSRVTTNISFINDVM